MTTSLYRPKPQTQPGVSSEHGAGQSEMPEVCSHTMSSTLSRVTTWQRSCCVSDN